MPEFDHSRSAGGHAGREWLIDAFGCCPRRLTDLGLIQGLFDAVVADLDLQPLGSGVWHRFAGPSGVTGMYLLSESHLTCHTWPEFGTAAFNLFCCRPRPAWPWAERLRDRLQAQQVQVRVVERVLGKEAGQ